MVEVVVEVVGIGDSTGSKSFVNGRSDTSVLFLLKNTFNPGVMIDDRTNLNLYNLLVSFYKFH